MTGAGHHHHEIGETSSGDSDSAVASDQQEKRPSREAPHDGPERSSLNNENHITPQSG